MAEPTGRFAIEVARLLRGREKTTGKGRNIKKPLAYF